MSKQGIGRKIVKPFMEVASKSLTSVDYETN